MKKYLFFVWMMIGALSFTSCGDDDDNNATDYEAWRLENEEAMNRLTYDPDYTRLASPSNMGSIYYKVLKEGEGTEKIYYNSKVKVYYTGTLINSDTPFESYEPPYNSPVEFTVSTASLREGWKTALQNMKVGDRWEIWIPHALGYGAVGSKDESGNIIIPPYSTLIFEIEVAEITEQ